jgi:hypothetical protein
VTALRRLSRLLTAVFYAALTIAILCVAGDTLDESLRAWVAGVGIFFILISTIQYGASSGHARREDSHEYEQTVKKARKK